MPFFELRDGKRLIEGRLFEVKLVSRHEFFASMFTNFCGAKAFINHQGSKFNAVNMTGSIEQLQIHGDSTTANWFTPNLFRYWKFGRTKNNLQYIQVLAVEIDQEVRSVLELKDLLLSAGVPMPHYVARSKTLHHWHVYWMIEPVAAYKNVVRYVDKITAALADVIGADPKGVGAERWFRVPRSEIYELKEATQRYTYEDFKAWFELFEDLYPEKKEIVPTKGHLYQMDIFGHPAIQKLMKGTFTGQRDNACFTLALTYYAAGWSQDVAEEELMKWNERNDHSGHVFRPEDVQKCVKSAYSGKYQGPKRKWVEELTGIEFKLRVLRSREGERKYHKNSDIQHRIVELIRTAGQLSCSQKEIAERINRPLRSVKQAIKQLIDGGRILQIGGGRGRGNVSSYRLSRAECDFSSRDEKKTNKGANCPTVFSQRAGQALLEVAAGMDVASSGSPQPLDSS